MTGFFDIFRKNLFWWARPVPPVGGPYGIAAGQAALSGAVAGNVAVAGAVVGAVF
jgi:hypothetical protein